MSQVKGKSEKIIKSIDDKKTELINKWEEMSHSLIGNFLDVFGKDGRIVSKFILYFFLISLTYR